MTFEQLLYITEVHRSGTILAASQMLNVSAPAISKAISHLEDELQLNIFTRTKSGSVATNEGAAIIALAQQILDTADEMRAMSAQKKHHLQIEIHPQEITEWLAQVVALLTQKYPNLTFSIAQTSISSILAQLSEQRIDFGIFAIVNLCKPERRDIVFRTMLSTRLCILTSAESPLAEKPFVTPEDLVDHQIVLPSDPWIYNNLRDIFQPVAMPKQLLKTNDQHLMKHMVLSGTAIGTCSELINQRDPLVLNGQLRLIPLQCRGTNLMMDYLYAYNAKKQLVPAERTFLQTLKQHLSSLANPESSRRPH